MRPRMPFDYGWKKRGGVGGGPSVDYNPSAVDADGLWLYNEAAGNIVESINTESYTKGGAGTPNYQQAGPASTNLDSIFHETAGVFWNHAAPSITPPGPSSWLFTTVMKNDTDYNFYIFDWDCNGAWRAVPGFSLEYKGSHNKLLLIVNDNGDVTHSQFEWTDANNANSLMDGNWHKYEFIFDRGETRPIIKLDTVSQTVTGSSNLKNHGDLDIAGGLTLGAKESTGAGPLQNGHAVAYAVYSNDIGYTTPDLP